MSSELTEYGFTFGAAEVTRMASIPERGVCIRIATATGKHIDVYVSAAGRSLRVFSDGEWTKP
jgi:hypothetical protein